MGRRAIGGLFILVAALLYATRYLAAAIWGSSMASWSAEHFRNLMAYQGQGLTTWSLAALVLGAAYLVWGEIQSIRKGE